MHTIDASTKVGTKAQSRISQPVMAWIVSLSASLYFFYEFIQLNIFNSLDVPLMQAFNISAVEIGHLSTLYFWANLMFLFPAGLLLDRLSTRKLIIFAMLAGSISTLVFSQSTSLFISGVCRFLTGIGAAFCFLSCIRIASRWFPPKKLALVTGVIVTMAMLGGVVAQTPLAILIEYTGWRDALLIDGLLGFVITAIIWFTVRDFPLGKTQLSEEQPKSKQLGIFKSLLHVAKNIQNWLCGIYTAFMNLPIFLLGAIWGIPYLEQVHNLQATDASYATSALFVGVILGSPAFGFISDLLLKRKLPMILGAVTSLATVLVLMYAPGLGLYSLIALFFLLGFFTSSQILSYPLIAEHNPINMTSTAISIASTCIMVSGIIAQPLFAFFMAQGWDHTFVNGHPAYSTAAFNHGMLMMPLAFVAGLILTIFIKESQYHTTEAGKLVRE